LCFFPCCGLIPRPSQFVKISRGEYWSGPLDVREVRIKSSSSTAQAVGRDGGIWNARWSAVWPPLSTTAGHHCRASLFGTLGFLHNAKNAARLRQVHGPFSLLSLRGVRMKPIGLIFGALSMGPQVPPDSRKRIHAQRDLPGDAEDSQGPRLMVAALPAELLSLAIESPHPEGGHRAPKQFW
jgi:hypothetical protein